MAGEGAITRETRCNNRGREKPSRRVYNNIIYIIQRVYFYCVSTVFRTKCIGLYNLMPTVTTIRAIEFPETYIRIRREVYLKTIFPLF